MSGLAFRANYYGAGSSGRIPLVLVPLVLSSTYGAGSTGPVPLMGFSLVLVPLVRFH
jgi:hypothetical protein